ncbi:MAG: tRNA pseudouridine(38-40) synthase TruA [Flavobacteriaceae bacterium]|nr:tRNA pseudouridine(38-40) synthase TruA [Flavobacteriaceae bacterium]MCY4217632.1 tRNA pseudouridine(38-40) synthase TruA [Flavobacteriaceae bacterium]MCY4253923.1 tRNA pseudouridine(38-40) synthase TruA [Flavobacteriaceae bacterium]
MKNQKSTKTQRRYFADFSYNGTNYHGWQFQKNALSIQQVLEDGLSSLLKTPIKIYGAGRTDSGVHALQMIAHFDIPMSFENLNAYVKPMNSYLGKDIKLNSFYQVKPNAQARFDAISRTYRYHIHFEKDVFNQDFSYYLFTQIDHNQIIKALEIIKCHSDFKCFSKSKSDVSHFLCEIKDVQWNYHQHKAVFSIKANRFLRGMVRCIVGTLIQIGKNKISIEELKSILNSGDRKKAGYSVPAKGLFLTSIEYPSDIYLTQ